MTIYLAKLAIAVFAAFSTIPMAHAIGDSGGCLDWLKEDLGRAVTAGTADEFRRAVTRWIDQVEKEDLGGLERLQHFASGSARQRWRDKKTLDLFEGNHGKEACRPGPLVPAAIRAGNVEVVRYLVGSPMGMSPKVWPITMFFACEHSSSHTQETRARRREAVGLLLESGKVHVNAQYRGQTILEACKEPELVTLFIERGADLTIERGEPGFRKNLLDLAIDDAISTQEGGSTATRFHAVERARIFSRHLPPSIEGRRMEESVRYFCNWVLKDKLWNPNTCRELSTFIKAAPGTFGPY